MIVGILDLLDCPLEWTDYVQSIKRVPNLDTLMFRAPHLSIDAYEEVLHAWLHPFGEKIVIHSHGHIAVKYHLKRLHLPYSQFLKEHRYWLDQGLKISTSVHSIEEAINAESMGCAAIIAGNVFETTCKPDLPAKGVPFIQSIVKAVQIPVYAIGGLSITDHETFIAYGTSGICIRSDLWAH